MDRTQLWDTIVQERQALAEELGTLTEQEWATPSLCAGWTVKDVAAHVISSPQMTWRGTATVAPGMLRHGYNGPSCATVCGGAPCRRHSCSPTTRSGHPCVVGR